MRALRDVDVTPAGRARAEARESARAAVEDAFARGSAEPVPTGLVSEGRTHTDPDGVGWTLRTDECALEGSLAFDRTTGEVAWRPTCKSARCSRCSRQVSAQTFALARRALDDSGQRVRFITLTRAPQGWEPTRKAVQDWLQHLRRQGYAMHVLWVVEKGSETGMKHVHAVQWGDYVPKEVLSASWPHGTTQIEGARAATDYLAKGVVRYVAKELDGDRDSVELHMNLNGGRAAHWSLDFFDGQGRNAYRAANPLPGIYFVQTARARRPDPDPVPWWGAGEPPLDALAPGPLPPAARADGTGPERGVPAGVRTGPEPPDPPTADSDQSTNERETRR